jgi:hypothetical protein
MLELEQLLLQPSNTTSHTQQWECVALLVRDLSEQQVKNVYYIFLIFECVLVDVRHVLQMMEKIPCSQSSQVPSIQNIRSPTSTTTKKGQFTVIYPPRKDKK